jgi:hypothetical protein
MKLANVLLVVALVGFSFPANAQQCGPACRKCASELGIPIDSQRRLIRSNNNAGGNMAFIRCVEEKRQATGLNKR